MGEGSPKLRPAYETSTYTTYIYNKFPCLRWRVSEISIRQMKKVSTKPELNHSYGEWASKKYMV